MYRSAVRKARRSGIVTGLPDASARGRTIGDYRRIALYGPEFPIVQKIAEKNELDERHSTEEATKVILKNRQHPTCRGAVHTQSARPGPSSTALGSPRTLASIT